jgi:hypothetical protein
MLDNQECLSDGYIVRQLRLLFAFLNRTLLIRCNICVAQRSCEVVLRTIYQTLRMTNRVTRPLPAMRTCPLD